MADCVHETVVREVHDEGTVWRCTMCPEAFVPDAALQQLEAETNGAIDMACAMFANIIQALYGAQGKPPPSFTDDKDVPPCEIDGHEYENGRCKRCGSSQFLGG